MLLQGMVLALLLGISRESWCTGQRHSPSRRGCSLRTCLWTSIKAILHQDRREQITSLPPASVSWVLLTPMSHGVSDEITLPSPFSWFPCLNRGTYQRRMPQCCLTADSWADSPAPAFKSAHANEWLPAACLTHSCDLPGPSTVLLSPNTGLTWVSTRPSHHSGQAWSGWQTPDMKDFPYFPLLLPRLQIREEGSTEEEGQGGKSEGTNTPPHPRAMARLSRTHEKLWIRCEIGIFASSPPLPVLTTKILKHPDKFEK